MSQILLVNNNEKIAQMYSTNLKMYVGAMVITKSDHYEAFKLLEIHHTFDLIISKTVIDGVKSGPQIYQYLKNNNIEIPLLLLGEDSALPEDITQLDAGVDRRSLIKEVAKILGITAKDMDEKVVPDYVAMPFEYFMSLDFAPTDIYLRVKNKDEEFQYIKCFHADSTMSGKILNEYRSKGVDRLYIISNDRLKFANSFTDQVNEKLLNENLEVAERLEVNKTAMKSVSEQINEIGLDENIITTSNNTMQSMLKLVDDCPKISQLLKLILDTAPNFIFNHCQIATYVSAHIIKNIGWGTEEQRKKLAFVAFFHDIALVNDKQARIRSEKELDLPEHAFTHREKESVRRHAQSALLLLEDYPHMPMSADLIIRQHHGQKYGLGFADQFTNDISPLAIVFIVTQEFTDRIINTENKEFDVQKAISEMCEKFKLPKYQKIVKTLEKLNVN